jgi:hypothetical protein
MGKTIIEPPNIPLRRASIVVVMPVGFDIVMKLLL